MTTDCSHLSAAATSFLVRTILNENRWSISTMARVTSVHASLLRRYANGTLVPSPENLDRILAGAGIRRSKEAVLAAVAELAAAFAGDLRESTTLRFRELLAEIGEAVQSAALFGDGRAPQPDPDPPEQLARLLSCDPEDRLHVARIATEFHSAPLSLLCCQESLRLASRSTARARELADLAHAIAEQLFLPSPGFFRVAEAHAYASAAADAARALGSDLLLLRSDWIRARAMTAGQEGLLARRVFDRVRRGLFAAGQPFEAIVATVELTGLLLTDSANQRAAAELSRELLAFAKAASLQREALSAVRDFQEAAAHKTASTKLALGLAAYLCRARYDPDLRFEAP